MSDTRQVPMVSYPLQLHAGLALLRLPAHLTHDDFDRIVAMMRTLVLPEESHD